MSLKHKLAITGRLLLLLSLLLVCLLAGAYFYLPFYLETRIIPRLAADAGLSDFAVNVRNIGFFSADLGTLRIGPRENPAFVIKSVQVDYSPRSLYKQKIETDKVKIKSNVEMLRYIMVESFFREFFGLFSSKKKKDESNNKDKDWRQRRKGAWS